MPHVVMAKCTYESFESHYATKFYPGDTAQIDLADQYQRRLAWLKSPMGKWVFEFDRAGSSDPMIRIWFCKDCGSPFDKFSDMGNHVNAEHGNSAKREVAAAQEFEAAQEEERIVARLQQQELDAQLDRAQALVAKLQRDKEAAGISTPVVELPAPEEKIVVEKRGKSKMGKTFTCKYCQEVQPNLYTLRMHYKAHETANAPAVQEAEPVTA